MGIGRATRKLLGLESISLKGLAIIVLAFLFVALFLILVITKIMDTEEKYNIKGYDPRDFQREEILNKEMNK